MPLSNKAKRFNRRQIAKVRKSSRRKSSKTVSTSVKRYVKRELHKQIETKSSFVSNQITFGSALESPDLNFAPILWYPAYHTLSIGAADGARIGNKVGIRRVMLRYVLIPMPYDASTNPTPQPVVVQLFLGRIKPAKSLLPGASDVALMFNAGSSSYGPAGSLIDLNSVVNEGYWDIKKKWTHKIGFQIDKNISTTYQEYSNNDFKMFAMGTLDITKMVQKVVQFNDSTSTPQNGNLFFGYQSIAATGGPTGATVLNCRINYTINIEYEDA